MRKKLVLYLVLLLSIFLLLAIAIYNKYPLINPDTGSYVKYAFDFQVPADRTPFYGVFTGFSSLWSSLWTTVIVQSLLVVFLLYRYVNMLWGSRQLNLLYLLLLFVSIILCTHLGWVVSFIMPDIFTAILILATVLYLCDESATVLCKSVYAAIIFVSVSVHNSHYLSYLLFTIILIAGLFMDRKKTHLRRAGILFCITVANWVILCTLNYSKGFGFTLSAGRHVFMTAKFVETGILQRYLNDSCSIKPLKLCSYKNDLPNTLSEYLWADYSPLYKTGGWEYSKAENDIIIRDVFTTPEYLAIYIRQAFSNSARQLIALQLPDKIHPLKEGSSPFNFISQHLPHEINEYKSSRQYNDRLRIMNLDTLYIIAFLLSTLWVVIISSDLTDKKKIAYIYGMLLLFVVLNAAVTAVLSEVVGRLHYRVFWVLPATNIIILLRHYTRFCQKV